MRRTPYDGLPYYCSTCGVGFTGYLECEDTDCLLETLEQAADRVPDAPPPSSSTTLNSLYRPGTPR